MAGGAPKDIYDIGFTNTTFELQRFHSYNNFLGGNTQTIEQGEPRWYAAFTTVNMKRRVSQKVNAWFNTLRGGLVDLLAYDVRRCYPIEYAGGFSGMFRAGGGSFESGTATVTALTGHTLSLSGLPSGFKFTDGDLVGLTQMVGGVMRYGLYEISVAVNASSAGEVTLTVEPAILTNIFTVAAQAQLAKPKCLMIVDQRSRSFSNSNNYDSMSFSAIQKLY